MKPFEEFGIWPSSLEALERVAFRMYHERKGEEAAKLARRVSRFDPERAEPHFILASVAYRAGDWEGALAAANEAISSGKMDSAAYFRAGQALLKLGRRGEARQTLVYALELREGPADRWANRADSYIRRIDRE